MQIQQVNPFNYSKNQQASNNSQPNFQARLPKTSNNVTIDYASLNLCKKYLPSDFMDALEKMKENGFSGVFKGIKAEISGYQGDILVSVKRPGEFYTEDNRRIFISNPNINGDFLEQAGNLVNRVKKLPKGEYADPWV